jgi:hypothetical protein
MCSVIWCLSCLLYVMLVLLHSHVFMHLHLASHLGMLDAPSEGQDVRAKPEDGVWWIHPEDGRALECMPGAKTSSRRCKLT